MYSLETYYFHYYYTSIFYNTTWNKHSNSFSFTSAWKNSIKFLSSEIWMMQKKDIPVLFRRDSYKITVPVAKKTISTSRKNGSGTCSFSCTTESLSFSYLSREHVFRSACLHLSTFSTTFRLLPTVCVSRSYYCIASNPINIKKAIILKIGRVL